MRFKSGFGRMDDFVAVGYPKTGNTWLRMMLGYYFQQAYKLTELPLFDGGERNTLHASGYRGPLGTFTHAPLTWQHQTANDLDCQTVVVPFRHQRVLLIVRHPLDVLVSHYMHMKFKKVRRPFTGDLAEFAADSVFGLDKLLRYYQIWARELTESENVMLLRYEDMKANTEKTFSALLEFIGVSVEPGLVSEAVRLSSFDNMRDLEQSGMAPTYASGFQMFGAGEREHPNAFHVREGKIGGYRLEFGDVLASRLEERVAAEMSACYGY